MKPEVLQLLKEIQSELIRLKARNTEDGIRANELAEKVESLLRIQPEQSKLERWKSIDFSLEPLTAREIARRKLEWLARELNKKSGKSTILLNFFIAYNTFLAKWKVVQNIVETYPPVGAILFSQAQDAEYALSQMTAEELEALR